MNRDMVEPGLITVLDPCTVSEVLQWPATSTITRAGREGTRIWFEHTKADSWPGTPDVFGAAAPIQGNCCLVAQLEGRWYAAGFDWLGVGRQDKNLEDVEFGRDQVRVAPMDASWPGPRPGQLVGLFVTTPSSGRIGARTVNERSNIVTFVWPAAGERAEYVLEEPPWPADPPPGPVENPPATLPTDAGPSHEEFLVDQIQVLQAQASVAIEELKAIREELQGQRQDVVHTLKEAIDMIGKLKLPFLALLAALWATTASAQVMMNPAGDLSWESADHALLASYDVGWFKTEADANPTVTEVLLVAAVTLDGTGTRYQAHATTRPPFGKYILRMRSVANPPCETGYCESPWSAPAVWSSNNQTGTVMGYTPAGPKGVTAK